MPATGNHVTNHPYPHTRAYKTEIDRVHATGKVEGFIEFFLAAARSDGIPETLIEEVTADIARPRR